MSLKDDLTEIDGVGDATAEKIIGVVDEHTVSERELERVMELLERGSDGVALSRLEGLVE